MPSISAADAARMQKYFAGAGPEQRILEPEPRDETVLRRFGENLRRARNRKACSQQALAEHSGIDAGTISCIERGGCDACATVWIALAVALDVRIGELLLHWG